ncbi:hypothetical protein SAMN05421829_10510 [Aromatoleum tolulyticum]|uniref:Sulphur transport domain-containing protein n=1 Tax=Aromatoleum tolulyticum TaxID=34027 RepID=A0A1N6TJ29_9RHOO|nr:DUF6691 family protein [Aromatoleum tolulyticum]SIQ53257.1 hypothetical protein SAMN05421829_10510 [Aromatoleum tolulyticum]
MTKLGMALLAGVVFGIGLLLAGMTDPQKVLAFLDLAGEWDPSLALVMISAIATARFGFAAAEHRNDTWLGAAMQLPPRRAADRRLFAGSALFGVGWGLAGFCPGPALVGIGLGYGPAVAVVVAMLAGLCVAGKLPKGPPH